MQKKPIAAQKAVAPRKGVTGARASQTDAHSRRAPAVHNERGGRLAWLIGGGIAVLVVLLVFVGYYSDNIGPAGDTAITAGKHNVSLGYYRDRLKAETVQTGSGSQLDAFNKESTVTDAIESEQIYLQRAGSLGASVNESDITAAMAQIVGATVQNGKLAGPSAYEIQVRNYLGSSGLSLDELRERGRAQALQSKVLQHFKDAVPKQTLAIKASELTFTNQDAGRTVQQRLENGDQFADIVADARATPSVGQVQDLDWTPVPFGLLPSPFDDVASKLTPGQVSDLLKLDSAAGSTPGAKPSSSASVWVLLAITDRDAAHSVSDAQTSQIAAKEQADWVSQQKTALSVHSFLDGPRGLWAATHTGLPAQPKATPTPSSPQLPVGLPGNSAPGVPQPVGPPPAVAPGGAAPGAPAPPAAGPPPAPPGPPSNAPVPNGNR